MKDTLRDVMPIVKLLKGVQEEVMAIIPKTEPSGFNIIFRNGYIISMVYGFHQYSDESTYEVAVLDNYRIAYEFTGGQVLSYQTLDDIRMLSLMVANLR